MTSLVVLKPRHGETTSTQLPIRIGTFEAAAISMGVEARAHKRPMTHDLLNNVIRDLGATLTSVVINRVSGTTFYAQLRLVTAAGETISVDARPSDAIALAVRSHKPIFADEKVLETATSTPWNATNANARPRRSMTSWRTSSPTTSHNTRDAERLPLRQSESSFHEKGYSHLNKRGTPLVKNRGKSSHNGQGLPRFSAKGVPLLFKWEYPFS